MRAFIAIDLPEDLRTSIHNIGARLPGRFSAVPVSNIHLTIHFLGEISDEKADEAKRIMASVKIKKFEAKVKGLSFFGGKAVQTIFANVLDGGISAKLHSGLAFGLEASGFTLDKKEYQPHITIARMKHEVPATKEFIMANSSHDFGSFVVQRISLKESMLSDSGPTYVSLFERELS